MKPQASIIWKLQQAIYRQTKKRASQLEGECSDELRSYRASQQRFAKRDFTQCPLQELLNKIQKSHISYLGDFHSFDQHSKNLSRILKLLISRKNRFSLGIEFIKEKHQNIIDAFLANQLTEIEFLEQVEYYETWRFPWAHYKVFFDIAKQYNLRIYALNSDGTLKQRDEKAASIISQFYHQEPRKKILVLFGELHIMPSKLPKYVTSLISKDFPDFKHCIIHQNLDDVYWRLHINDIENDNHIVKFNDEEYSLQTSPPWIKYESMIYWYEYLSSDSLFELQDHALSSPMVDNVSDIVVDLCLKITTVLSLKVKRSHLEDINIYHHQHLDYILERIMSLPKKSDQIFYRKLLEENRIFKLKSHFNYYCSSYSINRISHIAGLHLFSILTAQYDLTKLNIRESFFLSFKREFVAYFASKVINPFLKCDLYLDLKDHLIQPHNKHLDIVIRIIEERDHIILDHIINRKGAYRCHNIAQTLARYCGEMLYEEVMPRQVNNFQKIKDYLFGNDLSNDSFMKTVDILIPKKSYHSHRKRLF
jgi:hypothetical protein